MEVPPIINLAHPARQVEVIEIDDDDILKVTFLMLLVQN